MREIKFRAWDGEKMSSSFYLNGIAYAYDNEYLIYPEEFGGVNPFGYGNGDKKIEIMQYTGLKDKNGKEIYEGDIVEMKDGTRNPYQIVWSFELQGWGLDGNPSGLQAWLSEYTKDIEIIGNIYESPELLK